MPCPTHPTTILVFFLPFLKKEEKKKEERREERRKMKETFRKKKRKKKNERKEKPLPTLFSFLLGIVCLFGDTLLPKNDRK